MNWCSNCYRETKYSGCPACGNKKVVPLHYHKAKKVMYDRSILENCIEDFKRLEFVDEQIKNNLLNSMDEMVKNCNLRYHTLLEG